MTAAVSASFIFHPLPCGNTLKNQSIDLTASATSRLTQTVPFRDRIDFRSTLRRAMNTGGNYVADSRAGTKSQVPLTLRLSKVFADPLRMKILAELNTREMSPKQFFEEFGRDDSLPRICRHFDVLTEYDWLYLVRKESGGRRRGAVEHFYKATGPAVFDEDTWPGIPDTMKDLVSWRILETFVRQVREAMAAGTMDARDDRHFTWTPLRLDEQGWGNVIGGLDDFFRSLFSEQKRANLRMAESGEKPIPMTVALAGFESPEGSVIAPWST